MGVRIVTDSSSCLPRDIAAELDITVIGLHVVNRGEERSTSGLSALELTAAYARQLERGHDDGVLAIHLSKDLSSTWYSAVTAAAVFDDDSVRVVDTSSVGMALGFAAIAAAKQAKRGATLEQCYAVAVEILDRAETWVYLNRLDEIRRSGRISTTTAMLSTALASRPIMRFHNGKMEIAAKTRTQTKAFTKLVELVVERAAGNPASVAIMQNQAREAAKTLERALVQKMSPGSSFILTDIDPTLAVHSGPGAVAVSGIFEESTQELFTTISAT